MTLPAALNDREYQKFIDVAPGETAVRVSGTNFSGTFTPQGLNNGGRITFVEIVDYEWRPLPPTPLADRNGVSYQNQTGTRFKICYNPTDPDFSGYAGITIKPDGERFYDIKDTILHYGKSESGTITVLVEELS